MSHTAVQKAVESGRLSKSVGRNAKRQPVILDVDLATKEWAEGAAKPPPSDGPVSLTEAQGRVHVERARALRLANEVKTGELIYATTAAKDSFEAARMTREKILNVPDRVAAEFASERDTARIHARLTDELHAALEAVADLLGDG